MITTEMYRRFSDCSYKLGVHAMMAGRAISFNSESANHKNADEVKRWLAHLESSCEKLVVLVREVRAAIEL